MCSGAIQLRSAIRAGCGTGRSIFTRRRVEFPAQSVSLSGNGRAAQRSGSRTEHESSKLDWQGALRFRCCFDELTHFPSRSFLPVVSEPQHVRRAALRPGDVQPDADSWVAEFVAWWIDQDTGLPIPERSGVVRWFVVLNDVTLWADSADELLDKYGNPDLPIAHEEQIKPKSATFVARLSDNPALLAADPDTLPTSRRFRQSSRRDCSAAIGKSGRLPGCTSGANGADRGCAPVGAQVVRYWDLAATVKTESTIPTGRLA